MVNGMSSHLGTDDGITNVGLMTKLYHIVAHNLNEQEKPEMGTRRVQNQRNQSYSA